MINCADWLWNLGSQRTGVRVPCLHTNECPWVWERREVGFWSWAAFWRTTAPEIGGDVWVRLSPAASAQLRLAEERG